MAPLAPVTPRTSGLRGVDGEEGSRDPSLDRPRGDEEDEGELVDALGTEDHGFAVAEDAATVQRLMRVLTEREREVLRLRFEEDLTQSEIGAIVGVSQMHVSRLIRQSIAGLSPQRQAAVLGENARVLFGL